MSQMTVNQAVDQLKAAGFADAHFSCGHVWFHAGNGDLLSINTNFRAMVRADDVAAIIHLAATKAA